MQRATHADWLTAPTNRWAFRHVREIVPTARIRRGPEVRELPPAPADGLLDLAFTSHGAERTVGSHLEESYTDACVVLHEGRLALEWLGPGVQDDEPHIVMSVSKSITALLAGALVGAGLLDPDAPVTRYIPEADGSAFGDATVRHLLDMTTATSFVEDYSPGEDVRKYRQSTGWYPTENGAPSSGLHAYLLSIRKAADHGEKFHYVSPNTDMLGWVCERAANLPYADAMSTYIWAPLGAERDGEVTVDRFGAMRAAGGLSLVPRDMARIGLLVADDGLGIIPADFVRDLREGGDAAQWANGEWAEFLPGGAYRSCFYQPRVEPGVAVGIGIFGQHLYADPVRKVVVVKQSSWPRPDVETADLIAIDASRAIAAHLAGG
jgi:CubicO group peptidase (beta-lactamase class C family)